METNYKRRTFAGFIVLMIALGVSDCLRGVFAPIFSSHFQLSASQLSAIVTSGYLGNLIFLMFGGRIMDRMDRRRSLICLILIWMASLMFYLLTDNYICLVLGMFFSLGSSTLLSTNINLYTTLLFAASPGMAVNFLFFTQGIGTSGGQSLAGNLAAGFGSWKGINLLLLVIGVLALLILRKGAMPEWQAGGSGKNTSNLRQIVSVPAFFFLILIFASYFIAEHGIMNWLVAYANMELGISMGQAANYTAVFFGTIMLGRLVFSPLVDRIGIYRSMRITGTAALILFVIGSVSGGRLLWVLSISGLFFSILYPTLVLCISHFYPVSMASSACGTIISIASLGDILFNAAFGSVVDAIGYGKAFLILPGAMTVCTVLLWFFTVWAEKKAR